MTIIPLTRRVLDAVPLQTFMPITPLAEISMPTAEHNDERVCRPARQLVVSRLRGPVICAPKSQWARMKAEGLEFAPDGKIVLAAAAEKARSLNPPPCLGAAMGVGSATMGAYTIPSPCM